MAKQSILTLFAIDRPTDVTEALKCPIRVLSIMPGVMISRMQRLLLRYYILHQFCSTILVLVVGKIAARAHKARGL